MFNSLMLSIFDTAISRITTAIIVLLVVGTIIFFFIKSSKFRVFCGYFLIFVLVVGGVFSGYHLNKYYNTKGGIVGQLTEIFNPNAVEVEQREDIVFDFSSVMMTQIEDDKYRAEFITDDVIELAVNEGYVVFVNDTPCELIEYGENLVSDEISSDYVISEYYHAFYDENKEFVLKDKLTFRFAFYKNSTRLIVETTGGEEAVSLWNSYFQKNDFIVKIKASDDVFVSSYVKISLMVDNKISEVISVKKYSKYLLPETYEKEGYRFMGWSLNGETIIDETSIIAEKDITYHAIFEKLNYVRFNYLNDNTIDQNSNIISVEGYILGETLDMYAPIPTKPHFEFVGWSFDGENLVDLTAVVNNGTITNIYAVWQAKDIEINVNLNEGTMFLNGVTYSDNFKIYVPSAEKIILSEPTKEGYVFSNYVISHPTLDYYFTISDKTLNLTTEEIFYRLYGSALDYPKFDDSEETDFEITSLNVKVQYITTAENIEDWTDDDLKKYIEFELGINYSDNGYVYESVDNDTWICSLAYELGLDGSEGQTLFVVEKELAEIFEIETEITEDMTTREFIELLYLDVKAMV